MMTPKTMERAATTAGRTALSLTTATIAVDGVERFVGQLIGDVLIGHEPEISRRGAVAEVGTM